MKTNEIKGDVEFPGRWMVFAPLELNDPALPAETLKTIPQHISLAGKTIKALEVVSTNCQFNFNALLGEQPVAYNRVAYIFVPLESDKAQEVTLGFGADDKMIAWLNGSRIIDTTGTGNKHFPPSIDDHHVDVRLDKGDNVLAVKFISGKASSLLALGGPRELIAGDFWSILPDPAAEDKRLGTTQLQAEPGQKLSVEINSRLELFIDDYLVDSMAGGAERRLHHPVPREIILEMDKPWEGKTVGYFAVVQDGKLIRIYYKTDPAYPAKSTQAICVIESTNGIDFVRPDLGLYEINGSKENNVVWRKGASGHNFTPFKDPNPAAPADQRYKAIAYHPNGGGLGAYGSSDGINWRMLVEERVIGKPGGFDSQNLAFWDTLQKRYVCYYRHEDPRGRLRGIWRQVSDDFIRWTDPQPLVYEDDRMEHMYINCIRPYFRAPHIYIGTPARFVPRRTKVAEHPNAGISDAVLMSSRDGIRFQRWEEAFIRPGPEPELWTDRNNYPGWGMVQTSPEEISIYWTEHYRHPGMRLRRGTIRTDGFVSIHAGGEPGEMITRPLVFSGSRLVVNYATSAIGSVQFELCDEAGQPTKGFTLAESEVLFGNELEHTVTWKRKSDIGALAGKPVRLRVRLHDADLYSIRFPDENNHGLTRINTDLSSSSVSISVHQW
jgi:hypothetical protein